MNHIYKESLLQDLYAAKMIDEAPVITPENWSILEQAAAILLQKQKGDYASVQSIFQAIPEGASKNQQQVTPLLMPFMPMSLSIDFFPDQALNGDIKKVVASFKAEYALLSKAYTGITGNEHPFAENLLFLLNKYATVLPSQAAPEISFYDYAKAKAAVAYSFSQSTNTTHPFALIGGDLSGIQDFIYDIVSKNASKNLKGRSYYLHLLTNAIVQRLLKVLQLPQANIVFASGGSFYVLAPNTDTTGQKVKDLEQLVAQELFDDHRLSLSLQLEIKELAIRDLSGEYLGIVWSTLQDQVRERKKNHRNLIINQNFNTLFVPTEVGGTTRRDAITNEEIVDSELACTYKIEGAVPEKVTKAEFEKPDTVLIKKQTRQQIMAGFFLKSEMYHVSGSKRLNYQFSNLFDKSRLFSFRAAGDANHFILDERTKSTAYTDQPDKVYKINDTNYWPSSFSPQTIYGFELYGGNDYPQIDIIKEKQFTDDDGNLLDLKIFRDRLAKTFSEMSGMSDDERESDYSPQIKAELADVRFKRLAILRMDVDGLGNVFRNGFGKNGTLSHFSALSRNLDWFFKGYLNTIWQNGRTRDYNWRDWIQIIYSGGDDLFVVGKWDCLIDFAEQVKDDFYTWTCKHPSLGISGGLVMISHKYPVIKAAEWCAQAEKSAKNHTGAGWQKNSLNIFDHPLRWQDEYILVKQIKDTITGLSNLLPKSFIMMIQAFYQLRQQQKELKQTQTWRWLTAYQLTRLGSRVKKEDRERVLTFIDEVSSGIFTGRDKNHLLQHSNYEYFDLLHIACRWAEYELRGQMYIENE